MINWLYPKLPLSSKLNTLHELSALLKNCSASKFNSSLKKFLRVSNHDMIVSFVPLVRTVPSCSGILAAMNKAGDTYFTGLCTDPWFWREVSFEFQVVYFQLPNISSTINGISFLGFPYPIVAIDFIQNDNWDSCSLVKNVDGSAYNRMWDFFH